MSTVSALLYYGAPAEQDGATAWVIDGLTRAPAVVQNFRTVAVETHISDLRTAALVPTLDGMGFAKIRAPRGTDHAALLAGSAAALDMHKQATAALLTAMTGADAIVFFDATLRCEDTTRPRAPAWQGAHRRVHVDQNPASARARAAAHGGAQGRYRRFQIINVWQPLLAPVRNFHLGLCDYRTIDVGAELVVTQLHFPPWLKDRENYSLRHHHRHRWFYWSALAPEEAIVFKCYDSACRDLAQASGVGLDGPLHDVAGLCPHSAFIDPHGASEGRLRVSLELRALLFYR